MQALQDEVETIHLYVVSEKEKEPYTLLPLFCAMLCLAGIAVLTLYSAQHPYYEHQRLTVPAKFLPLKVFTAAAPIIPTGVKTYPATYAEGVLTLTNGSVLSEVLPPGVIFGGQNGEVQTEQAVFIPAGSANRYGTATVPTKALRAGKAGNIVTLAINAVYGTALYVRNLTAFRGGRDSYSVRYVTAQDKINVLQRVRTLLSAEVNGLHYPCKENFTAAGVVNMTWRCQFVSYRLPTYMHVTAAHLSGRNVLVDVAFVPRPQQMRVK